MKAFVLPTIFTAVDKFTSPVQKMNKQMKAISQAAMQVSKTTAIMGAALLAPLIVAGNEAVKFEDRMADISKTTQISGKALNGLGEDILSMSTGTRTSIEGLQKIAEIGGQMGIQGREGILEFTDSVNKFNVALGSDFQGGVEEASRAIGGLNTLFKETRNLKVADSITRVGSAINALSSKGVQVPEVTEFVKRIGQLPDAIKPTIQETAALGAVFNKAGISAEIAARGVGDVLLTASQNAPKFAKQMGISVVELQKLIDTNPAEFLKKFSATLKGMPASKFGTLASDLKLGDVGSIKVLGTLASSMDKLTEFQKISNDEFTKGTSLLMEYNTKNETMAAKLARSKNNFEALSIIIGTELLPVIGDLINDVMPVVKQFTQWVKENKGLVKTILKLTLGLSALMFTISVVSALVAAYATVTAWATTVQAVFNGVMAACPLLWVVLSIMAVIAAVVLVVKYWDSWGASITMLIGIVAAFFSPFLAGLALVVSLVMSFVRNWDMITKAFKEGGILAGIKAIGATLLDAVLMPLQQILEVIASITGADWAKSASKNIEEFRKNLGVDVGVQNENQVTPANPQQERQQSMLESFETVNNKLAIDINDPSGRSKVSENTGGIPISLKSTHNYGK